MALQFEEDGGYGARGAMGLIVLASDETLEPEIAGVATPAGVSIYHSRIPSAPEVTTTTLAQMEQDLPGTAALLPGQTGLQVVGYGCTSGTTVIGAQRVHAAVRAGCPDVTVTDPLSAALTACKALDAQRVGFLTPYVPEVSQLMRDRFEQSGLHISRFASFEQSSERVVARITENSVLSALHGLAEECDVLFTSCTNLRSFGIIEQAEQTLGKPVLSSNSALWWHMLRLSGDVRTGLGPGELFNTQMV